MLMQQAVTPHAGSLAWLRLCRQSDHRTICQRLLEALRVSMNLDDDEKQRSVITSVKTCACRGDQAIGLVSVVRVRSAKCEARA